MKTLLAVIALFVGFTNANAQNIERYTLTDFSGLKLKKFDYGCNDKKGRSKPSYALTIVGFIGINASNANGTPENIGNIILMPVGCEVDKANQAIQILNAIAKKQVDVDVQDGDLREAVNKIAGHFGGNTNFTDLTTSTAEVRVIKTEIDYSKFDSTLSGPGGLGAMSGSYSFKSSNTTLSGYYQYGLF